MFSRMQYQKGQKNLLVGGQVTVRHQVERPAPVGYLPALKIYPAIFD